MNLIEAYIRYQDLRTSSPKEYGAHLIIQLLGHSLGRESVCRIQPKAVHHNIYLSLMGKSGVTRKTTAQDTILTPLIPIKNLGTKHFSPEGLLKSLENQPQLLCPLGEFSTLLRGIKAGGYLSNFKEIANDLFNCPEIYKKKLKKKTDSYNLEKPYLSLSTTCTEEEFFPNLTPDMLYGGFLPRWVVVKGKSKYRPRGELDPIVDELEITFRRIIQKCYDTFCDNPITFKLNKEANIYYNKIVSDWINNPDFENLQPFIARYQNYLIAYADIILLSDRIVEALFSSCSKLTDLSQLTRLTDLEIDNLNKLVNSENSATEKHIKRALRLLNPSLLYAKQIVKYVDEDYYVSKLTRVIEEFGLPMDYSDAMRRSKLTKPQMKTALDTLIDRKELLLKKIEFNKQGKKYKQVLEKYDE
jgi:hypothetical protein